jgi:pimeloyl-ACP methyl ester carboxylesterase
LGTCLFDLLEAGESEDRSKVFDIGLLADRLLSATEWIEKDGETRDLTIGYFGASTGAAAALEAAAKLKDQIKAVVSRGGRPDLALNSLAGVTAPTLLIVGGHDEPVISMNQEAYDSLPGIKDMVIVPGATHLFEEPGALEEVARLAGEWFERYLTPESDVEC